MTPMTGPWPSEWNREVISLIASGFAELTRILEQQGEFPVPYPPALQRGLDRLSAMAITANAEAPRSVMALVDWAHRPFVEWPFCPAVEGLNYSETLLEDGKPTKTCLEWAALAPPLPTRSE